MIMEREIVVTTMRAYDKECIGCKKHGKHLMISFQAEKHGIVVHDMFLDKNTALVFQKELDEVLSDQVCG